LKISGTPLLPAVAIGKNLALKVTLFGDREQKEMTFPLSDLAVKPETVLSFAADRFVFFRCAVSGLRANNFLLRNIDLLPDYRAFCRQTGENSPARPED
jgi:hypothetical protein